MTLRYGKILLIYSLLMFAIGTAAQAPPQPACSQPEAHQFDFWVGTWDLTWPAGGGQPAGKGVNTITRTFDGCVVQENFDGALVFAITRNERLHVQPTA